MTDLQRAALRSREIQTRLAELGGKSEYDDSERSELDKLRGEFTDLQRRMSALEIADMTETATPDHQEDRTPHARQRWGSVRYRSLARKRKRRERRDTGALRHRRESDTPRHACGATKTMTTCERAP